MNKLFQYSALAAFTVAGLGVAHADLLAGTSIGGKTYIDGSNISQKLDGADTNAKGFGFDVKRGYFTVTHKFDDTWSVSATTDFQFNSNDGKSNLFIKKAFVQGNFYPLLKLRAGVASTPWIPYVEHLYGFRYVEKTVLDRFGLANSADVGLHALGKQGILDYQVSVVNGGGYSNVTGRSVRPDLSLRVGLHPLEGFTIAGGFYDGKRAQEKGGSNAPTNTQTRYDAVVAYVGHGLRLGGEAFIENNPVKTTQPDGTTTNGITGPKDKAIGYSLFASYEVFKPVTVFGRYDHVRLSKNVDPSLRDSYFNVGAQYAVRKGILVSLVYKYDRLRDNTHDLKTNEIGIFSEIKF